MCVHVRTWVCACMCALCVSVSKKHSGLPPFVVDGRYQKKNKKTLLVVSVLYSILVYYTHTELTFCGIFKDSFLNQERCQLVNRKCRLWKHVEKQTHTFEMIN